MNVKLPIRIFCSKAYIKSLQEKLAGNDYAYIFSHRIWQDHWSNMIPVILFSSFTGTKYPPKGYVGSAMLNTIFNLITRSRLE